METNGQISLIGGFYDGRTLTKDEAVALMKQEDTLFIITYEGERYIVDNLRMQPRAHHERLNVALMYPDPPQEAC